METTEQEKQVMEFKKVGNGHFAKKKYKEAVGAYSEALDLFRSLSIEVLFLFFFFLIFFFSFSFSLPLPKKHNMHQQEIEGVTEPVLLSNRAAALIALKKGEESLQDATLCVSLSPKWVKVCLFKWLS